MSPEFEKFLMEKVENYEENYQRSYKRRIKAVLIALVITLLFFVGIIGLCIYLG